MIIGLLRCYDILPQLQSVVRNYEDFFPPFFAKGKVTDITIKVYDLFQDQWPQDVHECAGYIISGSPASVYDDAPWLPKLFDLIRVIDQKKIKLVGICFGHQAVATALGGTTANASKGWGVGAMTTDVINAPAWMTSQKSNLSLLYSHQDQVTQLPETAILLSRSNFCPNAAYTKGHHIFCLQGHPEFSTAYLRALLPTRIERLGQDCFDRAMASLTTPTDEALIARWLGSFFNYQH